MFNTTVSYKNAEGKKVELVGQKWETRKAVNEEADKLRKTLQANGCTEIDIEFHMDSTEGIENPDDADKWEEYMGGCDDEEEWWA